MATVDGPANHNALSSASSNPAPPTPHGHQRTKSSVLRSFIQRINNSSEVPGSVDGPSQVEASLLPGLPAHHNYNQQSTPLDELQQNQQDQTGRPPKKQQQQELPGNGTRDGATQRSPRKMAFTHLSLKTQQAAAATAFTPRDQPSSPTKLAKFKENASPTKPKKAKSATNLAGLLSRPKSFKNLQKLAKGSHDGDDVEAARAAKDKENRTPPDSLSNDAGGPPPPIYAQFARANLQPGISDDPFLMLDTSSGQPRGGSFEDDGVAGKQRPKSFQPQYVSSRYDSARSVEVPGRDAKQSKDAGGGQKSSTWGKRDKPTRPRILTAFSGVGLSKSSAAGMPSSATSPAVGAAALPLVDPKEIDAQLEAMLDRRNIPENQRYKMRNLTSTVKMEFIRQDWAETHAQKLERPHSNDGRRSREGDSTAGGVQGGGSADQEKKTKSKHSRVKSLTLSRGGNKAPVSPTKKKGEGSIGRHFRTKSTDSVASEGAVSTTASPSSGFFSKAKSGPTPGEFVSYLRKVQKPELVEVGKLHKLRLLLRNETVAWTEDFIRQGGMEEVVGLLHRIMEVEWREEHEDALLHENLLCLKALCTTDLALQYLHSIQATLLPALIHMIFDPEKKGPSEFTTRNIVTSVLFTYIQSASPPERVGRAQTLLSYLRDPEDKEEERPVSFVLEMRRDRPYRVWCKELVSVTKEVFWIFLHNLNVVALPADKSTKGGQATELAAAPPASACPRGSSSSSSNNISSDNSSELSYMIRHFPQERPPVPAAPYVGGVEWDATNYLASHLDLVNAILACTPSAEARNGLRSELQISGWERCMGGSLRLCKEKFYGAVHDGLRTWVAAAHEDGWNVKDVRYGPPAEARSPVRKVAAAGGVGGGEGPGGRKKAQEAAPRIEIPKLDFGLEPPLAGGGGGGAKVSLELHRNDPWLS